MLLSVIVFLRHAMLRYMKSSKSYDLIVSTELLLLFMTFVGPFFYYLPNTFLALVLVAMLAFVPASVIAAGIVNKTALVNPREKKKYVIVVGVVLTLLATTCSAIFPMM